MHVVREVHGPKIGDRFFTLFFDIFYHIQSEAVRSLVLMNSHEQRIFIPKELYIPVVYVQVT